MSKVDLHVHSTASDGQLSPKEIIHKAAELGLTVVALTDHDTIDGIAPALSAAKPFPQMRIIPGIEISTEIPEGEVHILGYFIDYTDRELQAASARFLDSRDTRAQSMIEKLGNLGFPLQWTRVRELAGDGTVGRPHIAQAMLERNYITSFQEAFEYIGHDGPAYVERDKMTPEEAIELIIRAGGLPVLAHPLTAADPEALVIRLKKAGLIGIEAYYKDYSAEQIKYLVDTADRQELIATGGTDYHGRDDETDVMMGSTEVPLDAVERLITLAEQRGLKSADIRIS